MSACNPSLNPESQSQLTASQAGPKEHEQPDTHTHTHTHILGHTTQGRAGTGIRGSQPVTCLQRAHPYSITQQHASLTVCHARSSSFLQSQTQCRKLFTAYAARPPHYLHINFQPQPSTTPHHPPSAGLLLPRLLACAPWLRLHPLCPLGGGACSWLRRRHVAGCAAVRMRFRPRCRPLLAPCPLWGAGGGGGGGLLWELHRVEWHHWHAVQLRQPAAVAYLLEHLGRGRGTGKEGKVWAHQQVCSHTTCVTVCVSSMVGVFVWCDGSKCIQFRSHGMRADPASTSYMQPPISADEPGHQQDRSCARLSKPVCARVCVCVAESVCVHVRPSPPPTHTHVLVHQLAVAHRDEILSVPRDLHRQQGVRHQRTHLGGKQAGRQEDEQVGRWAGR